MLRKIVKYIVNNILYRVKIYNSEVVNTKKRIIICPNHSRFMDGVIFWANNENVCVMAKKELFKNKMVTKLLRSNGIFPIDRGKNNTQAIKMAINFANEHNIVMFPHGTRKKGIIEDNIYEIKNGFSLISRKVGACIVPTYITEEFRFFQRVNIVYGSVYIPPKVDDLSNKELFKLDGEEVAKRILECKKKIKKY